MWFFYHGRKCYHYYCYYFYSYTRKRFYWVTFKLEDIHRPKFCATTFFICHYTDIGNGECQPECQPPYQLVLMVICNATLKLAELVPCLFLLSSKNSVAFDIYLGKWQTVEPLLTILFIVNFSNEFSGTKRQSSRSFRKCT